MLYVYSVKYSFIYTGGYFICFVFKYWRTFDKNAEMFNIKICILSALRLLSRKYKYINFPKTRNSLPASINRNLFYILLHTN